MRRWVLLAGLFVVAAVCGLLPPAIAHGVLEAAAPPPNASLASPPDALELTFSEAGDPAFTAATVIDQTGRSVSGPSRLSTDGRRLRAALQPLPRGIYTVRWHVLSAVDGHTTTGAYAFAVGVAAPAGSATSEISPPPVQVIVRWISYASALLLAGAAFFIYFIARPALAVTEPHLAVSVEEAAAVGVRLVSVPAALVLIVSLGVGFVLQAQALFETSLPNLVAAGQLQAMLSGTRLGWSTLLQGAMAAVLLIPPTRRGRVFRMAAVIWAGVAGGVALIVSTPGTGVTASRHFLHFAALLLVGTVYGLISVMAAIILPLVPDLRLPRAAWAAPAAGAILLVGITLNAHAGGEGYAAMGADWLHLAAAATWIGGLVGLVVTLRAAPGALRSGAAQALLPRFSRFAGGSLLVLVITGTYAAWLNIPAWSGFLVTRYGWTLLIKLALVLPWIALGVFNHFVMRPRLARVPDQSHVARFVRLIGGEVALAGAVLLAVAALTITPPARVTIPVPSGSGIEFGGFAGQARIRLSVRPARAGWNAYEVNLGGAGTTRLDGRVQLRFMKLDEDIAPATTVLRSVKVAVYRAEGADLGQSGWWRVDVIVRVRGQSDRTVEFPLFLDGAAETTGEDGSTILAGALARARAVSSWREIQQITDGRGDVVVTRFGLSAPDRLRFATSSGSEAVIIGTHRYSRDGGPWREDSLPTPVVLGGPFVEYLRDFQQPTVGREDTCGDEPCRIVFWQDPTGAARFAGWVGERSRLVYRLLMVAPRHYMTATAFDFDVPLAIAPPK